MSDFDITTTLISGAAGAGLAFVAGMFKRNVSNADRDMAEVRGDVKQVLLNQQTHASELKQLDRRVTLNEAATDAAHRRLDSTNHGRQPIEVPG